MDKLEDIQKFAKEILAKIIDGKNVEMDAIDLVQRVATYAPPTRTQEDELRAWYWVQVGTITDLALEHWKESGWDAEARYQFVNEQVDGHTCAIWAADALTVLRFTENGNAFKELNSFCSNEQGMPASWEEAVLALAVPAMRADVEERIRSQEKEYLASAPPELSEGLEIAAQEAADGQPQDDWWMDSEPLDDEEGSE